ncbi:MAG: hypothetical protein M0D55_12575 [Elusimicrobiota bacterium]|nr:MAG: hypothetical protein M0D55_12575 [Elusimicrobiota bacterium]
MRLLAAILALWLPFSAFAASAATRRDAGAGAVEGPASPCETFEAEDGETAHASSFEAGRPCGAAPRHDAGGLSLRPSERARPLYPPPNPAAPR